MAKAKQGVEAAPQEAVSEEPKKAVAVIRPIGVPAEAVPVADCSEDQVMRKSRIQVNGQLTRSYKMAKAKQGVEAAPQEAVSEEPKKAVAVIRPIGVPAEAVPVADCSEDQVMEYEKKGKLAGFNPLSKIAWVIPALLLAFSVIVSPSQARADLGDEATIGGQNDDGSYRWRVNSSGNLIPGKTASSDIGSSDNKVNAAYLSGDLTFRSNLLANGREDGGSLTLQSSSTTIGSTQLAYTVILKRVGGAGGLDEAGIGTALANGTPGQTIHLIEIFQQSGGSWDITPVTKTGFTTITLNAVGEYATLLYVDDTLGWIIVGTNGAVA